MCSATAEYSMNLKSGQPDDPAGFAGLAAGACGGRTIRQSAAARTASIDGSWTGSGIAAGSSPGLRAERGAEIILPASLADTSAPRTAGSVGSRAGRPSRAPISGARKRRAQTMLDTGLPGRPARAWRRCGRTSAACPAAWRSARSRAPCPASALPTRSWSPTEAPPSVTSMSAGRAVAGSTAVPMAASSSRTMPRSRARRRASDVAPRGPVRSRPRSGRGRAASGRDQFVAGGDDGDRRPTADGEGVVAHGGGKRDLAHAEGPPRFESSRLRGSRGRPAGSFCRRPPARERSPSQRRGASAFSWMSTASAPSGTGAPVKMRDGLAWAHACRGKAPAAAMPMTRSCAGTVATSAARTA